MLRWQAGGAGILVGMLALASSGCEGRSDDLPREGVSGSVTMDGQPLAKGTIQFAPTSDKIPTTITAGINDGKYSVPHTEGLVPGTYKVAISSFNEVAETPEPHHAPGKVGPAPKNLIPKQFNTASTLTAEVKGGEANTFDFEITKKEVKAKRR
jgi:hypothetical protein